VAVDHPLVADALGARLDHRRVGALADLGHGEAAVDVAVEDRPHPLLLLLRVARDGDELGVAGVRGLVPEDDRADDPRLAHDLVQQGQLDLAPAGSAHVRRQVGGEHPRRLHLGLQRIDDPPERLVVEVPERLDREHLLPHELSGPVESFLERRLGLEAPGHQRSSSMGLLRPRPG
jgi:hypothetical protein